MLRFRADSRAGEADGWRAMREAPKLTPSHLSRVAGRNHSRPRPDALGPATHPHPKHSRLSLILGGCPAKWLANRVAAVVRVQQNNTPSRFVVHKTTFWLVRTGRVWIIAVVHP